MHAAHQCLLECSFCWLHGIVFVCELCSSDGVGDFAWILMAFFARLMMMLMIDVLRPLLHTWYAKWTERPPNVMKWSKIWITLQMCPRRDSNSGGSDMWSSALPIRPRRRPLCHNEGQLEGKRSYCCSVALQIHSLPDINMRNKCQIAL